MKEQPFSALSPEVVLDALESVGQRGDGRLLALNSYENRVYQAGMEDGPALIAKFYRAGRWTDAQILEEHRFVAQLSEREIPVIPAETIAGATLHAYQGFRFSLFRKQGGRAPEFESRDTLEWMGRFIARIHAIGKLENYDHRPAIDIYSFGEEPSGYLLDHDFVPLELVEVYRGVVGHALAGVKSCYQRAGTVTALRLHGDCHAGNVLWTDAGPHFVDFDDSRTGPAIQDLWMLLSGSRDEQTRQLSTLLSGYQEFLEFDARELHLVEALRTLRLINYAVWIARRWEDPAFALAFPWFNTQRYWQDRILELREQIALMDEAPLAPAPT
jgi:Ser/Thr protein kinase RdoA (MazF antagonist)